MMVGKSARMCKRSIFGRPCTIEIALTFFSAVHKNLWHSISQLAIDDSRFCLSSDCFSIAWALALVLEQKETLLMLKVFLAGLFLAIPSLVLDAWQWAALDRWVVNHEPKGFGILLDKELHGVASEAQGTLQAACVSFLSLRSWACVRSPVSFGRLNQRKLRYATIASRRTWQLIPTVAGCLVAVVLTLSSLFVKTPLNQRHCSI